MGCIKMVLKEGLYPLEAVAVLLLMLEIQIILG